MRFRITAIATVATTVVLTVASAALVVTQRRVMTENVTETLEAEIQTIETLIDDGALPRTLSAFGDDDSYAEVTRDGQVVAATGTPSDESTILSKTENIDGFTIRVGASIDDVLETTTFLITALAIAVPAVAALLAVVVWWLVGRTLAPVEAIRLEVAAINADALHRRVPEPAGDDEISRLARTMNDMIRRVETATEGQRRFVADASHELRSPLTRMRTELEVDLIHAPPDPLATHRSVLEETVRMQQMVDDLLHLARLDAGVATLRRQPVDLDEIVRRHAAGTTADLSAVRPTRVSGDGVQLGRLVVNLLDNAARHARDSVTVALAEAHGQAVLTVEDDGAGVPDDQRERIFERFTRVDEARNSASGGAGLGLAIARDIVERHGGTITADGAKFTVRLPLDPV